MTITLKKYLNRLSLQLTEKRIYSTKNKKLIESWTMFKNELENYKK